MVMCAVALLFVQANCDLALPDFMSDIVNTGVIGGDIPFIWKTGRDMLLVALLGAAASVAVGYFAAMVAASVARDLRSDVYRKVGGFSNAEFDRFSTASLITRTTNDITQVQMLMVMLIRMVFYAPIMGFGGVMKALANSASMTWVIGVAVTCLIGVVLVLYAVAMPKFKAVQSLVDRLNLVTRENLEGMLVVRAFNTQEFERGRFDKANRDLTRVNLFVNRAMSTMMPTMMLIMNLTTVAIVWVGARLVSSFKLDVGSMMAYMQYSMQIIMSFLMLAAMFILVPRAAVSADRIKEVLETEQTVLDPEEPMEYGGGASGSTGYGASGSPCYGASGGPGDGASGGPGDGASGGPGSGPSPGFRADVEFRHVCFHYPGGEGDVLRDISFTARAGQTTAFIGATGSGKSTIANLAMRFYDVTGGQILVGGIDVRDVRKKDLRALIGYVPQKSVLFSGTVMSNISYADKGAPQWAIEKAASVAQAKEFIDSSEEGYGTPIAQGGANVSGGQKQRLSIARALAKDAPIYIFDDSFSALDLKTDSRLRAALKEETGGSTVLLVAQRVGTIMNADQIIVVDNGAVVGKGTHGELLESCEVYYEIASSQLSEAELAKGKSI